MSRQKRIHSIQNQYHLISRGINKSEIFLDRKDYYVFISILREKSKELNISIYAYCLMNNHYHILAGNFNNNLPTFMKMLGDSYVYYFNKKYNRIGALFQDRFKSEPVNDEAYFLTLIRYIHQNPEKAKIANTLTYPWSSIHEYLRYQSFIKTDLAIDLLGGINPFVEFVTRENCDYCMEYLKLELPDEEALSHFKTILNIEDISKINDFSVQKRNNELRKLKTKGFPIKQISRITGFSNSLIKMA